jgi:hypothetical protein
MKIFSEKVFSTSISKDQAKDSGMALVLIFLLTGFFTKDNTYYLIATAALLIDMVFPIFYYPFAIFWFGLSKILGAVMSKVVLTVIYLVVLLPVAFGRRLLGKDPLLLKKFKKSNESVMRSRNHQYTSSDLEKPF